MWYLQGDTLLLLCAFALAAALLRLFPALRRGIGNGVLLLIELAILGIISRSLLLWMVGYAAIGLLLCRLLLAARRKWLFALLCLLAALPLALSRADAFGLTVPFCWVTIGMAFHMLKLIDAFYYVYYTGEAIDTMAFANYMLFLPVFTAGPVFRYRDFIKTYRAPLVMTAPQVADNVKRVIRGLFKKIVLQALVLQVFNHLRGAPPHWYISVAIVVLSYGILWLDLSGYSDMAIGLGRIAGYDVPENFKQPLRAPTFTQFWRSWHVTVSDWIREHIYVVVAKKRLNRAASACIALVTMVAMGLWHGFTWPCLLSGLYLGVLLMLENLTGQTTINKRKTKRGVFILRCAAVNFLFAVNTLVFTVPATELGAVLRGFLKL